MPAGLESSESSLLGPWTAVLSLCLHMVFPLCISVSSSLLIRTPVTVDWNSP